VNEYSWCGVADRVLKLIVVDASHGNFISCLSYYRNEIIEDVSMSRETTST